MRPRRWSVALAALVLGGTLAGGSTAATAHTHDRIMFTRRLVLTTAEQDGSDARRVVPDDGASRGDADWSPGGRFAVYTRYLFDGSGGPYLPEVWVLDVAKGTERRIATLDRQPSGFDWSPDGKSIAYEASVPNDAGTANEPAVWVMDADGTGRRLLAREGSSPRWSPDGRRLVFTCDFGVLCLMNADGSGRTEIPGTSSLDSPDWAPDGVTLVATQLSTGSREAVVLSVDGVVERRFPGWDAARWSPDGDLAFVRSTPLRLSNVCAPEPCAAVDGIHMAERDGSDVRRVTTEHDQNPQFAR